MPVWFKFFASITIPHPLVFQNFISLALCINRDSQSNCSPCLDTPGCRFASQPFNASKVPTKQPSRGWQAHLLRMWVSEPSTCPKLNSCDYISCATSSQHKWCAGCGSLDKCMDYSKTVFVHCQGKVLYRETCPYPFTEPTTVDGNLVVQEAILN